MINKKSQITGAIGLIIIFAIMVVIAALLSYGIYVVGNNYVGVPLTNITNYTNFDPMINQGIEDAGTSYQNTNLDIIDYGSLGSIIILTLSGLMVAYKSRQLDYYSFLGVMTYGMMGILFILSLVEIVTDFFFNLIINLFPTLVIDLPITSLLLDNLGVYVLVLVSFMMLINQLDFDLAVITRRKDKEFEDYNSGSDEVV